MRAARMAVADVRRQRSGKSIDQTSTKLLRVGHITRLRRVDENCLCIAG